MRRSSRSEIAQEGRLVWTPKSANPPRSPFAALWYLFPTDPAFGQREYAGDGVETPARPAY